MGVTNTCEMKLGVKYQKRIHKIFTHLIHIFQGTLTSFQYSQHNSLQVVLSCTFSVFPAIEETHNI